MEITQKKSVATIIMNSFLLVAVNLVLMSIIGYLTLDSNANLNSRIGAILLSLFIPIFIVIKTQRMSGIERMLKFGFGFIAYIIIALCTLKLSDTILTGLVPCLTISLAIFFYGKDIMKRLE